MHYGELWRRHRRWFQTSFQTASALESYIELQYRESMRLISDFMNVSEVSRKKSGFETGNTIFSGIKRYVQHLQKIGYVM